MSGAKELGFMSQQQMPIDLGSRLRDRIVSRYPALVGSEIPDPDSHHAVPIDYRKEDIEKYHAIFWHRLLRLLYQDPPEFEGELYNPDFQQPPPEGPYIFRATTEKNKYNVSQMPEETVAKLKAGDIRPRPVNWKYFVKLPTGGTVELGTKDANTIFYIARLPQTIVRTQNDEEEARKFIDLLLEEANRLKERLFNPIKEFEREESLRAYWLVNVYLANYRSAECMQGTAKSEEVGLRNEVLKYDARTPQKREQREHTDDAILVCGMFYFSAISFFLMALEGFVNVVFHAFLRKPFRDKDFNIDQRLDLEQKLRFMTALCNGFKENSDASPAPDSGFKKLKKYRNSLFHSKVEDSLKQLGFVEDGFVYTYDMDEHKERFLPSHKIKLTDDDVSEVKRIVDELVSNVLDSMKQDTRALTEKYIQKETFIPFVISEEGGLILGGSPPP